MNFAIGVPQQPLPRPALQSNIGFINRSGETATVTVELWHEEGYQLGETVTLTIADKAGEAIKYHAIYNPPATVKPPEAYFFVTSDREVYAYGSIGVTGHRLSQNTDGQLVEVVDEKAMTIVHVSPAQGMEFIFPYVVSSNDPQP